MTSLTLTVNDKRVTLEGVEARTHLADLVRDRLDLTGTHLGCEHGVCGACTLFVDGVPARSCITLAVACEGARVTTVEGMDDDVMKALRKAFTEEHALQCGFCTPGMLASAHDVVQRMPDATEQDIRYAMSGNLCRCTGYVGIVRAVKRVVDERRAAGAGAPAQVRNVLGPVGSGHGEVKGKVVPIARVPDQRVQTSKPQTVSATRAADSNKPMTTLTQSFTVDFPRDEVWAYFGRLGDVTTCLPGASLMAPPTDTHVEPRLRVKVGPIVAEFEGVADVERDPATWTGTIFGSARDTRSSSATRGEIRYVLSDGATAGHTVVDVEVKFALTGSLAQFSRTSIVRDIAQRMTDAFATNLRNRLSHSAQGGAGEAPPPATVGELDAGALVFTVLRNRIAAFFKRLFGR